MQDNEKKTKLIKKMAIFNRHPYKRIKWTF